MTTSLALMVTLMFNKTPMSMLVLIIFNSLMISYLAMTTSMDMWGSLLLVMVYVSGVMVLFMYIVSLSPMKSPKTNSKQKANTIMVLTLMAAITWMNPLNQMKLLGKFESPFEKFSMMIMIAMAMLVMMGMIIPKISMINYKGLKSSN